MKQFKIKIENNKEFRAITILGHNDEEATFDYIVNSVVDGASIDDDKPVQFSDGTSKLDFINKDYKHAKNFLDEGRVTVSFAYKTQDVKFKEERYKIGTLNKQIADRIKRVIDVAKKLQREIADESCVIVTPLCFE